MCQAFVFRGLRGFICAEAAQPMGFVCHLHREQLPELVQPWDFAGWVHSKRPGGIHGKGSRDGLAVTVLVWMWAAGGDLQ